MRACPGGVEAYRRGNGQGGGLMKYCVLALVLAVFAITCAWATGSQEEPFPHDIVKCCVKSRALDTPPRCFETSSQGCFKQGGTEVRDCAKCK